ncbi:MAG: putative phage abortive infection protein [Bacteroidales bacterium]|jgi:hypothetical protein|nr:putative phage abortive infection protein [Bacteroidales bacterium]
MRNYDIEKRIVYVVAAVVVLLLLGLLFMLYYGKCIEVNDWGDFATLIGSTLLAITLLFQVRTSRKQQVEAKFFEMVRYYRNNIEEMRMKNPFFYTKDNENIEEEYVEGRMVIKLIFEQYKVARRLICNLEIGNNNCAVCDIIKYIIKDYKDAKWVKNFNPEIWNRKFVLNDVAYLIVYWGVRNSSDTELERQLRNMLTKQQVKGVLAVLRGLEIVKTHGFKDKYYVILRKELEGLSLSGINAEDKSNKKKKAENVKDPLTDLIKGDGEQGKDQNNILSSNNGVHNFFFEGNQYYLGHFFRHLYAAVEYIDNQPFWLFMRKDKYHYIKMLTAQMSNYEQAMLFIDSLTQLGRNMDYSRMHDMKLITKYSMIKALPESFIPDFEPQYYYPAIKYDWKV